MTIERRKPPWLFQPGFGIILGVAIVVAFCFLAPTLSTFYVRLVFWGVLLPLLLVLSVVYTILGTRRH